MTEVIKAAGKMPEENVNLRREVGLLSAINFMLSFVIGKVTLVAL